MGYARRPVGIPRHPEPKPGLRLVIVLPSMLLRLLIPPEHHQLHLVKAEKGRIACVFYAYSYDFYSYDSFPHAMHNGSDSLRHRRTG